MANMTYIAGAAANTIVSAHPCTLLGVVCGNVSATVEVSDSATDGDGNIKLSLVAPVSEAYIPVNVWMTAGIAVDTTTAGMVTIIWK
jgi:hypothetical protein